MYQYQPLREGPAFFATSSRKTNNYTTMIYMVSDVKARPSFDIRNAVSRPDETFQVNVDDKYLPLWWHWQMSQRSTRHLLKFQNVIVGTYNSSKKQQPERLFFYHGSRALETFLDSSAVAEPSARGVSYEFFWSEPKILSCLDWCTSIRSWVVSRS